MAQSSTSFKPGNQMWRQVKDMGRPEYWTEDKLQVLIENLEVWMMKEDSLCLAGYRGENYITYDQLQFLFDKSPAFKHTYKLAQQIVASRMASKLGNGVHVAHYNKYQSCYDHEIKNHDKEMMIAKTTADEENRKAAQEEAKDVALIVKEQIEHYRAAVKKE